MNDGTVTRRGLLGSAGLLAAAGVLAGCGSGSLPAGSASGDGSRTPRRIRYADQHADQYADLLLPKDPRALVVLLHGGYWLSDYGADLMVPLTADLQRHGLASWNVEYRRVGDGGGWPGTFSDVALAIDHVARLPVPETLPVVLLGHSAGGQLAVWAATRDAATPGGAPSLPFSRIRRVVSLSGVLDLGHAVARNAGNGAAYQLMGGDPAAQPQRYALGDPVRRVPARTPVTAVHAHDDEIVPLEESSRFVDLDRAAGGSAELRTVPGGHFDLIDPSSTAWAQVRPLLG